MKTLRELAEGQKCWLRLPGCSHDPEKTVLCHIRRGNVGGTSLKPPDVCAIPMDQHCHDIFDARTHTEEKRKELDAEMLRALNQWLEYLWKHEYLIAVIT